MAHFTSSNGRQSRWSRAIRWQYHQSTHFTKYSWRCNNRWVILGRQWWATAVGEWPWSGEIGWGQAWSDNSTPDCQGAWSEITTSELMITRQKVTKIKGHKFFLLFPRSRWKLFTKVEQVEINLRTVFRNLCLQGIGKKAIAWYFMVSEHVNDLAMSICRFELRGKGTQKTAGCPLVGVYGLVLGLISVLRMRECWQRSLGGLWNKCQWMSAKFPTRSSTSYCYMLLFSHWGSSGSCSNCQQYLRCTIAIRKSSLFKWPYRYVFSRH